MREKMYVIATKGRQGKEIYLACDEKWASAKNIRMKWTEDINEAMATFDYADAERCASSYFKNFTKWYIKEFIASFK